MAFTAFHISLAINAYLPNEYVHGGKNLQVFKLFPALV
jgi:hypothetical protein